MSARRIATVFGDGEVSHLRRAYDLALGALRHTHHVDDVVESFLADAVLSVCGASASASTNRMVEEVAVASIERLFETHRAVLQMKH